MAFTTGRDGDSDDRRSGQATGSTLGTGIAIGAGMGVALGVALDMLPLGIAIGAAMGVAIGAALEHARGDVAPVPYGNARTRVWILLGLGLTVLVGLLGVLVFLTSQ